MGLRITTWNVNGIRNPFSYQPWRGAKSFASMFDILEADIVIFQETKIQRKDLTDDMVLVPGWDCYWSLPRYKKGYSGVVIYTRQSTCAPIRAEEGITGILCPPNSSTSFFELPKDQQIGGYPIENQLAGSNLDAATVDSEGRCVILEFPAFVLIGVYCPANRDESRDDFRLGFLNLLDARVRNLVVMGKHVFLTGDLNISREELDTANAEASMRKCGMTAEEYFSTPSRRLFNQLLTGSKIIVRRDEGREEPVMWDICRAFHPGRRGMFTCWEQKVNARPGNHGSRIDYVLCSLAMKDWFSDSNIQEGLMGSDHCPVYAIMKDKIYFGDGAVHTRDLMNPAGMYKNGQRQREYTKDDMLPLSGKLIPEFDGRRSIRDMFSRHPSLKSGKSKLPEDKAGAASFASSDASVEGEKVDRDPSTTNSQNAVEEYDRPNGSPSAVSIPSRKRSVADSSTSDPLKRTKTASASTPPTTNAKGQQSLKGFFKPKGTGKAEACAAPAPANGSHEPEVFDFDVFTSQSAGKVPEPQIDAPPKTPSPPRPPLQGSLGTTPDRASRVSTPKHSPTTPMEPKRTQTTPASQSSPPVHDPVVSAQSWSKLFTKPAPPRCESHHEACTSMLTKKPGINNGRSFWMCARPLGPSGAKERGTQWRCGTFIWCSDWNPGKEVGRVRDDAG